MADGAVFLALPPEKDLTAWEEGQAAWLPEHGY